MVTYGPPSVAGEKQSLLAKHDVLNHRYVGLSIVYWHTLDLRALLEYGILPCLCCKFNTHCLTQIFTFSGGVECLRETGRESYVKHVMLLNVWLENKKTTSINDSLYNDGDSSNCHGTQKNSSYGQIQGPEELRIGTHTIPTVE